MKRVPWWVWVSAAPFGLGAWTPLVPGAKLRRRSWNLWGAVWSAVTIGGWIAATGGNASAAGGLLIILGWAGAIATTLSIRPIYLQRTASAFARSREAAERRLQERREAQRLAATDCALALELGVGRPDRRDAHAAGLVDVNNASSGALRRLPGIDRELAHRIIELRGELNGFSSVEDLGGVLELDADVIERLRDYVVCLPHDGGVAPRRSVARKRPQRTAGSDVDDAGETFGRAGV